MSQVSPGSFLFHFHRSYPWGQLHQYATLRPRGWLIRKYCNLHLFLSGGLLRLCRKDDDVDERYKEIQMGHAEKIYVEKQIFY